MEVVSVGDSSGGSSQELLLPGSSDVRCRRVRKGFFLPLISRKGVKGAEGLCALRS